MPAIRPRNNSDVNKEEKKIFNNEKQTRKVIASYDNTEGQSNGGATSTDSASSSKGNTPSSNSKISNS
jgi:hypothetical protein